jgi:hypothetical protein
MTTTGVGTAALTSWQIFWKKRGIDGMKSFPFFALKEQKTETQRRYVMKVLSIALSLFLASAVLLAEEKGTVQKNSPGFEKLKALAGEWSGKAKDGTAVGLSYRVVSNGTAVMEMLNMDKEGEADMITVYHPDGDNLMMTHYCSANNQPRMKAEPVSGEVKALTFSYLDATNLTGPEAGHMHRLAVIFQDKDHFTQEWTWREKGKDAFTEVFKFERKK